MHIDQRIAELKRLMKDMPKYESDWQTGWEAKQASTGIYADRIQILKVAFIDEGWESMACFVCRAQAAVPELIKEIENLRRLLAVAERQLSALAEPSK